MQLGIIGLPAAGKTTIFNALTGEEVETGPGAPLHEVRTAVVDVPDPRLEALSQHFKPQKTTHAKVSYADLGGLGILPGREGLPGPMLNTLQQMDGLLIVVRAFRDPRVGHPLGSVDPARDLEEAEAELLLNDMIIVERRIDKLGEERQRGARERSLIDREIGVFEALRDQLDKSQPLRDITLSEPDEKVLAGFGLLTRKPLLVIVNLGEGQAVPEVRVQGSGRQTLALQGKLEMEISQLPEAEAESFLQEYGIEEPLRDRVIRTSYELLGLISFFTLNEAEARAWTLHRGGTALEAAGTVHSDLERGFIRAEVIEWRELLELGSFAQARAEGKLRAEGKGYPVQDGEVLHIRFNI